MANNSFQLVILEEARDDILALSDFFSELRIGLDEQFIDALGDCLLEVEATSFMAICQY